MNYSEQATYGRKIVKGKHKEKLEFYKRLYISWGVCILIGFVIGALIVGGIGSSFKGESKETLSYGSIYEVKFDGEASLNWESAVELGFVPLDVPMDEDMQEFIYCLSYGYNIEFPFVMAIIEQESYFKEDVVSKTNDYGLMQINSINHEWLTEKLGVTDFLDPYQNTQSGIFILTKLFEKYEDPAKVLMAYNMGETGAKRLWEKGIYETNYSSSIMKQAVEYKNEILERKGEQ